MEIVEIVEAEMDSLWISEKDGNSCSMKRPFEKPVTSRFEAAWYAAVVR
jgi:hypothetical protein